MALAHEEFRNHVGRGLSEANQLIDLVGNGTFHSADTTVDGWKTTNRAQLAGTTIHECDRALIEIANRHVDNLNAMGIYDNTAVAASNTTALWRAQFTDDDPTFPADYHGSRG